MRAERLRRTRSTLQGWPGVLDGDLSGREIVQGSLERQVRVAREENERDALDGGFAAQVRRHRADGDGRALVERIAVDPEADGREGDRAYIALVGETERSAIGRCQELRLPALATGPAGPDGVEDPARGQIAGAGRHCGTGRTAGCVEPLQLVHDGWA